MLEHEEDPASEEEQIALPGFESKEIEASEKMVSILLRSDAASISKDTAAELFHFFGRGEME